MATSAGDRNPMRARFREQVREDVKSAALRQISSGGAEAVSVNAIARDLGVSGPALYRYFSGRDELLAELVVDAYGDLADSLADATDRGLPPPVRVRALAGAWRSFALAEPHRYRLLFAPPLPGYDAHSEMFVSAANRAMAVALDVVAGLEAGSAPYSGRDISAIAESPREMLAATLAASGAGPEDLLRVISMWTRLHGFVGLEIGGNFLSMGMDADALFGREVEAILRDLGATGNPA